VIELFQQGRGRNEISKTLGVSQGSTSGIISSWKKSKNVVITTADQIPPAPEINQHPEPSQRPQDVTIESQMFPENSVIETTVYSPRPAVENEDLHVVDMPDIDFSDTAYKDSYPYLSIEPVVKLDVESQTETIKEKDDEQQQPRQSASLSVAQDSLIVSEEFPDWDSGYQSRFVKWVLHRRHLRNTEKKMLELHWRRLKEERQIFDKRKKELESAEDDFYHKVSPIKDLMPIAAELKSIGFEFSHANAWISMIREYALKKKIDERTAIWRLCDDLKSFEYLGGFETAISNAKHQLELLDIAIEDKKEAVAMAVDLKKHNIGCREILEVVETIRSKNNGHRNFELDAYMDSPKPTSYRRS
jgi:hypothetical protein